MINLDFKIKKDKERLKEISNKIEEKETTFNNIMKFDKQIKSVLDLEKHKRFSKTDLTQFISNVKKYTEID